MNKLSQRKKEAWVRSATFDAVTFVAANDAKQLERIQRVRDALEEYGEEMPPSFTSTTKSGAVNMMTAFWPPALVR